MDISKRFDELKIHFRCKNWKAFADLFGTKDSNIYSYRNSTAEIPDDILEAMEEKGINRKWITKGEGNMLISQNPPIINNHKGVPYYSMDVTGSLVRSFSDIQEAPEFYVDFKPLNDCTAYLTVHGDSMFPKYCSGDIVAVKKFNNCDTLLWGEAYMVITDEEANCLRTIKLIHQHPENDKIILRASNPNYPGDTIIPKKNIVNIFIVKGKIKLEQF